MNFVRVVLLSVYLLVGSIPAQAYVLLPLHQLSVKGITLSAIPGFYAQPLIVKATKPSGITLLVSTSGNLPDRTQPFSGPLNLTQTTSVTIGLFDGRAVSDTFYAGTYFIDFQSVLPVTSLILPPSSLFDPSKGIYVGGLDNNGERWGNSWGSAERESFFEYYVDNELVLGQGVGLRIFGGMTRQNAEKSLRIIARKKYGKGRFKYKIFSTKEADDFNSLVLRTSGNDWMSTRFKDMMLASIAKDIGVDYLAYQPSVLFINGQYWGIHNIREKVGQHYLQENHGADPAKTNLLQGFNYPELGSATSYRELFNFLETHAVSMPGYIDSIERRMDIDNYFNYLIFQIHINNVDSRGNVRFWQSKSLDNRFRWIFYDGDLGFGTPQYDYLKDRLSPVETKWHNPPSTTFLLRTLTAHPVLRAKFISTYCFLLSTWIHADTLVRRIDYFKQWLEPEIKRHLVRKEFSQSKLSWLSKIAGLRQFATARMVSSFTHLRNNFNLGLDYSLVIDSLVSPSIGHLSIEGNPIPSLPYSGRYFTRIPVRIAIERVHAGYEFAGWEGGPQTRTWDIVHNDTSRLVIRPLYRKRAVSFLAKKVSIRSIGHGKKNAPRFIHLDGSRSSTDSITLVDRYTKWQLTFLPKKYPVVIVNDTTEFRRMFKDRSLSLISCSSLAFKGLDSALYLLDYKGALIDSVMLLPWIAATTAAPYWIRGGDDLLVAVKDHPGFQVEWLSYIMRSSPYLFYTGLLMMMALIVFVIVRRRLLFSKKTPLVLLLFISSFSVPAQTVPERLTKKRTVDTSKLRANNLIFKGKNGLADEFAFFRSYLPIAQPLIWVSPFDPSSILSGNWQGEYSVESFKEIESDQDKHRHMLFRQPMVSLFISGVNKDIFLIDTVRKTYMMRIEHMNGMESWYYPIVAPNLTADITHPGAMLGRTAGYFYWQLRFRTCSVLPSAFLMSNGGVDGKGFVIENNCPPGSNLMLRKQQFFKVINMQIEESIPNADWQKLLDKKLNL
ncbi:MAG: hypothetical protein FJX80_00675 [Bacteroidetes bacterium]|nr:hypothetical protein [Bacteroidota bacterium]